MEGYVFMHYKQIETETIQGWFLAKYYGPKPIIPCFQKVHWDATAGWKYSSAKQVFITPEDEHMKENFLPHDHNKGTIIIVQE